MIQYTLQQQVSDNSFARGIRVAPRPTKSQDQSEFIMGKEYEKCPTHQQYFITNFCVNVECREPLCAECISIHTELHQQNQSRAKIQNIYNVRTECMTLLDQQLGVLDEDLKRAQTLPQFSLDSLLIELQNQKNLVISIVEETFNVVQEKLKESLQRSQEQVPSGANKSDIIQILLNKITELQNTKRDLESITYVKSIIDLFENELRVDQCRERCQLLLEELSKREISIQIDDHQLQNLQQSILKLVCLNTNQNKIYQNELDEGRQQVKVKESTQNMNQKVNKSLSLNKNGQNTTSKQINEIQHLQKVDLKESLFRSQCSRIQLIGGESNNQQQGSSIVNTNNNLRSQNQNNESLNIQIQKSQDQFQQQQNTQEEQQQKNSQHEQQQNGQQEQQQQQEYIAHPPPISSTNSQNSKSFIRNVFLNKLSCSREISPSRQQLTSQLLNIDNSRQGSNNSNSNSNIKLTAEQSRTTSVDRNRSRHTPKKIFSDIKLPAIEQQVLIATPTKFVFQQQKQNQQQPLFKQILQESNTSVNQQTSPYDGNSLSAVSILDQYQFQQSTENYQTQQSDQQQSEQIKDSQNNYQKTNFLNQDSRLRQNSKLQQYQQQQQDFHIKERVQSLDKRVHNLNQQLDQIKDNNQKASSVQIKQDIMPITLQQIHPKLHASSSQKVSQNNSIIEITPNTSNNNILQENRLHQGIGRVIARSQNENSILMIKIEDEQGVNHINQHKIINQIPQKCQIIELSNNVMFLGGNNGANGEAINDVYTINPTNKETLLQLQYHSKMITKRLSFGACKFENYIYVAGGMIQQGEEQSAIQQCEKLNLDTKEWQSISDCHFPCSNSTLCAFNGFIFKIGGKSNFLTPQNGIEYYDQSQNEWKILDVHIKFGRLKMPTLCGAVQINQSQIIIFGGQVYDVDSNESYVLDISNQTIERFSHLLPWSGTIRGSALSLKNNIYSYISQSQEKGRSFFICFDGKSWRQIQ